MTVPLFRRRVLCAAALWAASAGPVFAQAAQPARAGCDGGAGAQACKDMGDFLVSAVRVTVSRKDANTAYQGVRTLLRLQNVSNRPLALGYREGSSRVTDNNGNVYTWGRTQVQGIGIVSRQAADAQFVLAPGQAREFTLENVLQYSRARVVAGNVFTHDFTLVEMAAASPTQVRMVREHAVSLSDLSAATGAAGSVAAEGATRLIEALRGHKK
jgi:hypothetical protein